MVTRDEVIFCYRAILGREPESEDVIGNYLSLDSPQKLGSVFLRSEEFRNRYARDMASSKSKWVAVEVLDRFVQWIDLSDRYVSFGCFNNNWEPSETEYFSSMIDLGHTVLDIGANIGWFTLVAAKRLGNTGHIHAFEPRPETLRMLKRTIYFNGLQDNVTVWPYALSDREGKLNLYWRNNTDNPGGSFMGDHNRSVEGDHVSVEIDTVALDHLLADDAPDVVKIDVEGAEPLVFRGARKTILRKRPPILSELHPRQLKTVSDVSPAQYISEMANLGYRCFLLEDGRPTTRLYDFPEGVPGGFDEGLVSVVFE